MKGEGRKREVQLKEERKGDGWEEEEKEEETAGLKQATVREDTVKRE